MIEIVDVSPFGIAGLERILLLVGSVEPRREPTEELGHGKVGLRVAVTYRRVDEHRFAGRSAEVVAAPQVAVEE